MHVCNDLVRQARELHGKGGSTGFQQIRRHAVGTTCLTPTQFTDGLHQLPRRDKGLRVKLKINSGNTWPTKII